MRLNKQELVHPIFYLLLIGILVAIPSYSLLDLFQNNLNENLKLLSCVVITYIGYSILEISRCVDVKKNEIIDGIYMKLLGYAKIKNRMQLKDIKEFVIYKNEKKYSEIRAVSFNGEYLIVKTIANRLPAEKELEEIKAKIKHENISLA
ncbi:hypothetical protein GKZ90_0008875 [Flavobacterium sp. MC2016-06]|jgi:hypothetical protein|uniref:hypothetical protein n=1 Tax=Flavobacterium sp. MC2016-06 TaxID=2676308 RepID=UPI0012BB0561|nr:hypothetical protein [Flavobacterium sp. MC2016-06]MBU3859424.1 hypothetical protein [Flavobacterium sp. MC2016-06]